MQKVFSSLVCAAFAVVAGASCDSGASNTDLNPDGPPMVRQVRMTELYTDSAGATNLERRVFAFGTHPDATPDQEHAVTAAKPLSNSFRIIMDELLVGNALEEISCRGQVDDDNWGSVPINATPDDIAKCAVQADVLPSSCKGPNAVCICERPTGCIVGTAMIDMGQPVGVLDVNEDGAADDTRFIKDSVGITCGTPAINVPIDLGNSFWEPSGNQQIPAKGGFEVLGPAIVLVPSGAMPTGAVCGLKFADSVVDKQGIKVCAPPDGDINGTCTPGDVSAFKFTVQILSLSVQGITEGQTQVATTDNIIVSASAPLDPLTVNTTNVTLSQGGTPTTITVTPINMNSGIQIATVPQGTLLPNTAYTLTLSLGIHDAFGQAAAAATVLHFTTGP